MCLFDLSFLSWKFRSSFAGDRWGSIFSSTGNSGKQVHKDLVGFVEPVAEIDGENCENGTEDILPCPEIAGVFAPAVNEDAAAAIGNDDK